MVLEDLLGHHYSSKPFPEESQMLVYANFLTFPATRPVDEIIGTFATWLAHRVRMPIQLDRMIEGIRSLKFRDNSVLTTMSTVVLGVTEKYPFLFNGTYSHSDTQTSGRRWTLEFGVRQFHANASVECSVLLKADERSTLIREPVEVSQPRLVKDLVQLAPSPTTPGIQVRTLKPESSVEFVADVERLDRRYPLVLLSCDRDGNYLAPLDELQSQLVGLCDILVIPPDVDTWHLDSLVGHDRCAYGGAARIFWTRRPSDTAGRCPSYFLLPPDRESARPGRYSQVANPIFAAITDHTNVPLALRHITREKVVEQVVRSRLERAQSTSITFESPAAEAELQIYQDLLGSVDAEIRAKDQETERLRDDIANLQAENAKLQAIAAGYGKGLGYLGGESESNALAPLREATLALHRGSISLRQALELIQGLYPDRVTVLPSAYDSATESDNARFQHCGKAADLLISLATTYWETLAGGGGDQHAKECFGTQAYAANERGLSSRGRSERSFMYRGRMVQMDKHLKIGWTDSLVTTLRIHFEWVAEEKRIVIGHCGRHLAL
ncbi:hypothetical protein HKW90_01280 [Pseudomonas aeruginosa]|nr:hypothetical protein [Pseudomonas aeruginosa]